MYPTLRPGQIVLVRAKRQYQQNNVVMLEHDGLEKIKRIATIDEHGYEVRGDNPSQSTDSRQFGAVDRRALMGKVVWPRV